MERGLEDERHKNRNVTLAEERLVLVECTLGNDTGKRIVEEEIRVYNPFSVENTVYLLYPYKLTSPIKVHIIIHGLFFKSAAFRF